jgi:hypothetical protein
MILANPMQYHPSPHQLFISILFKDINFRTGDQIQDWSGSTPCRNFRAVVKAPLFVGREQNEPA